MVFNNKLKPLRNLGAFDGEKYKAEIPRDISIKKTCQHKDIRIVSGTEIVCKCGVGFKGSNILTLYNLLKNQSSS